MQRETVLKKIEKRGSKWVVLDSSGKKVLGRHATRAEAVDQLRAIEASKARRQKSDFMGDDLNEEE